MSRTNKPSRVKSTINAALNWIGFSFAGYDQWSAYYGGQSTTGETVTADKALKVAAVWACVRLYSQTVATLPIGIYRRTSDGRESVPDHLLYSLLSQSPNSEMTAPVFWENIIASVLLRGNAYAEIKRVGSRIVSLEYLLSDNVVPKQKEGGGWEYKYTNDAGKSRIIDEKDIFHIPGFTTRGKFGLSVIEYGSDVFGGAMAANKVANKTFANGLHQTIAFKYPEILRPEQRTEARATITDLSGASNAGKPIILEAGMDTMPLGINPNDAQLLESRNYSVDEVCSWFGLFPVMIGFGDKSSSWASSAENLNIWWLQYSLRAVLKRVEAAIWSQLIDSRDKKTIYAEYGVEGLLRADTASRTSFYSTALQNGWMSRNEVRRLENLPPVDGGNIYTAQSNLLPLDQLGKVDAEMDELSKLLNDGDENGGD